MLIELKKIENKDLETIRQWRINPDVSKYLYTDPQIIKEEQKQWWVNKKDDEYFRIWLITVDGIKVGIYQIEKVDYRNKNVFWGYYIADKNLRGKGVGRSVECSMYDYIFDVMGMHKACTEVFSWNRDVVALHVRNGCMMEGLFKEQVLKNGLFMDVIRLGLLHDDWIKVRKDIVFEKAVVDNFEEPCVMGNPFGNEE